MKRAPIYSSRADELFLREIHEDPDLLFSRLREECPLSRVGDTGVHLVATWDLVEEALGREADFSAHLTGVLMRGDGGDPSVFPLPPSGIQQVIATADEPEHSVHRALIQPALTPARSAALETQIRRWTAEAIGPWLAGGGGEFVPISELIPARVVAAILGLPDGDLTRHRTWAMMGGELLAGDIGPASLAELARETVQMAEYLRHHLEKAGSSDRGDAPLLQTLARGVEAGAIDRDAAVGIAIVLFGAGGESTAALIGSAVRTLATSSSLADELRADRSLLPRFVEEVARLETPFKFHYRSVRRTCELGGFELEPGDRLMLLWGSVNRDDRQFEEPNALRLDRRHPKQHMSFGRGAHFCVGAPLARLEARVICEELLDRTRSLSLLAEDPPRHARSLFVRRLDRLPLQVVRAD